MLQPNWVSLRGLVAGAACVVLLGSRWASAASLPYTVSITPTVNLTNVYVANYAYNGGGDSNLVINPLAASVAAGTTATASGSNDFDSADLDPADYTAMTLTFGVYQNGATPGLSIGYGTANAAGILAAGALGVDTSYESGSSNTLPGFNPANAADPTTHGVDTIYLDDPESAVISDLQNGFTDGTVFTLAQNLFYSFEVTAPNSLTDPSLTLLNFSNATAGGTAEIVQTVQTVATPEPVGFAVWGVTGLLLLCLNSRTLGRPF